MIRYTREMRGIPLWLLREYLQEIGGRVGAEGRISGNGWIANLAQLEDYRVGSLHVGQVRLEIEATQDAWVKIHQGLEKKLLRAGG